MIILHGGQTGVDRGAHDAAIDNGWTVRGYMPKDGRDELGLIPADVARHLLRCVDGGYPARTRMNVQISYAVLLVVPDEEDPQASRGTALTWRIATELGRPRLPVNPRRAESTAEVSRWIRQLRMRSARVDLPILVAGPRASRWPEGHAETAGLLRRVKRDLDARSSSRTIV